MSTVGLRGKWAEGKVKETFDTMASAQASFCWYRFPDRRSGNKQPVPADFEMIDKGRPYLLEVKEVSNTKLLPHKNFDDGKIARCWKRELAGATVYVLIYHEPLGAVGRGWQDCEAWRLVPLSFFRTKLGGSWNLEPFPLLTFGNAIKNIFA